MIRARAIPSRSNQRHQHRHRARASCAEPERPNRLQRFPQTQLGHETLFVSVAGSATRTIRPSCLIAGKDCERVSVNRQMHFAHGKVVEAEAQFRRNIGVGRLLMRLRYVEADARRADVSRATVRSFHDTGSAAGGNDIITPSVPGRESASAFRSNTAELASNAVELRAGAVILPPHLSRQHSRQSGSLASRRAAGIRYPRPRAAYSANRFEMSVSSFIHFLNHTICMSFMSIAPAASVTKLPAVG